MTVQSFSYEHIYNKGINGYDIFRDEEDFSTFESYLEEYLTPVGDLAEKKKKFTINGKTYVGTPHQPKNYHGQIELISFNLFSNHFHILIKQGDPKMKTKFLRSLLTRYSMYFNKKYNRTGSLFNGPFKSALVSEPQLAILTYFIHSHGQGKNSIDHSSYSTYLDKNKLKYVTTTPVTDIVGDYKEFTSYLDSSAYKNDNLKDVLLEEIEDVEPGSLERNESVLDPSSDKEISEQPISYSHSISLTLPKFIAAASLGFVLLFSVGLYRVQTSKASSIEPGEVAGASDEEPEAQIVEPIKMVVVQAEKGILTVNVRSKPTTRSVIILKAKPGEEYKYLSETNGWNEVEMPDGTKAYISDNYSTVKEVDQNTTK